MPFLSSGPRALLSDSTRALETEATSETALRPSLFPAADPMTHFPCASFHTQKSADRRGRTGAGTRDPRDLRGTPDPGRAVHQGPGPQPAVSTARPSVRPLRLGSRIGSMIYADHEPAQTGQANVSSRRAASRPPLPFLGTCPLDLPPLPSYTLLLFPGPSSRSMSSYKSLTES